MVEMVVYLNALVAIRSAYCEVLCQKSSNVVKTTGVFSW